MVAPPQVEYKESLVSLSLPTWISIWEQYANENHQHLLYDYEHNITLLKWHMNLSNGSGHEVSIGSRM